MLPLFIALAEVGLSTFRAWFRQHGMQVIRWQSTVTIPQSYQRESSGMQVGIGLVYTEPSFPSAARRSDNTA